LPIAALCALASFSCGEPASVATVATLFIGDATCDQCTITVTELGVIGNDTLGPTVDARLASSGDSIIVVAPLRGRPAIGVFLLDGSGRAPVPLPSSWQSVAGIDVDGDGELAILSEQRTTIALLSPAGRVTAEIAVPQNTHRFLRHSNMFVANAELRTPDGIGLPLHLVTPRGKVRLSFGTANPSVVPRTENIWRRRVAMSATGSVWSVHPDAYRLELWSTDGALHRRLERASPWWDSTSTGADPAWFATEKPRAEVIAVWEDSAGLLWTQLKVAAPQWRPLSPQEMERRRDAPFKLAEYDEFFETVIEVIDPAQAAVVASLRIRGAVGLLLKGNLFAKWVQSGQELFSLQVLRLSLSDRRPAPPTGG
jgi:hypothetical protein